MRYIIPIILLTTTACMGGQPSGPHPEFAPAPPIALLPISSNGAIFQTVRGYAPLTSGARAAAVGDVLTIQLVERTKATKASSSATSKQGGIGLTPPTTGPLALFKSTDVKIGGDSSFSGSGQAAQSNSLAGEITVTISEMLGNGTMRVRGEKLVSLNRGEEYIRFTGIVRAADISSDNRVLSTRLADARITYAGSGEIAQASKQGWLQKFFSAISPF